MKYNSYKKQTYKFLLLRAYAAIKKYLQVLWFPSDKNFFTIFVQSADHQRLGGERHAAAIRRNAQARRNSLRIRDSVPHARHDARVEKVKYPRGEQYLPSFQF